jgi:hypothetical protein
MCYGPKRLIAGRSPLRLATLSLPTHREVVAAALRISALGAPQFKRAPRLPCVPCCVSAFHAAAIRQFTFEELDKPEAMTSLSIN